MRGEEIMTAGDLRRALGDLPDSAPLELRAAPGTPDGFSITLNDVSSVGGTLVVTLGVEDWEDGDEEFDDFEGGDDAD